MQRFAVVKTGGKQYLVRQNDIIIVDRVDNGGKKELELETLATFDCDKKQLELGMPLVKHKVKAEVLEQIKGDKIRIARFKAKVRYRKVKGFRAKLTKLKIQEIN